MLLEGAKTLRLAPYIPHFWFYRSKILLKSLYPELAAVDAYKGVMLVNAALIPGQPLARMLVYTTWHFPACYERTYGE
jgi:hypothetical protein